MEEKKYYVYMHVLNDEVIYVGKGSGSRRYFSHRSKRWKEIVGDNKALIKIEIVERYDDEEDAYKHEEQLTTYYKSIGQCKANINIGKKHSKESKRKISEKGKGENNSMYGKKFSEAHRRKLSESHKQKLA
ncbi:NUMOD3 domain-containing DNA-binding protein [Peribacillus frigoritolerans]|uniref:NUMOD3 domain-containing DNA-binding protein n=1 Tax=Peribacillus castrilensis TaxID=2897690 RepID=UPI003DA37DA5